MDVGTLRVIRNWARTVRSFEKVFHSCILIAAAGFAVLLLQYALPAPACTFGNASFPATICVLSDSPRTPWGIVTSLFVHESFAGHYLPNMIGLFAFAFFFARTNDSLPEARRESRQRVFIGGMFASAIAANLVWLWLSRDASGRINYGSSGLVYAALGVTLAYSLDNLAVGVLRILNRAHVPFDRSDLRSFLSNLFVFALLAGVALVSPATFLSAGPGVNVLAHGLGFFFTFVSITVVSAAYRLKEGTSPIEKPLKS